MFSFPDFNREHAEAKRCWMEAIMSDCKFPTDIFEVIKFDLVDVSAAAVIKINTSLALLLPLVSFLFVIKV